jgi:hypothetical protein
MSLEALRLKLGMKHEDIVFPAKKDIRPSQINELLFNEALEIDASRQKAGPTNKFQWSPRVLTAWHKPPGGKSLNL